MMFNVYLGYDMDKFMTHQIRPGCKPDFIITIPETKICSDTSTQCLQLARDFNAIVLWDNEKIWSEIK